MPDHEGAAMSENSSRPSDPSRRRAAAFALSILLTGLGHISIGHARRGAGWFGLVFVAAAGAYLAAGLGKPWLWWSGLAILIALHFISAFDTLRLARAEVLPGAGIIGGVLVATMGAVYLLSAGARRFLSEAFRIPSDAMYPTLRAGDEVLVSKLDRHLLPGDPVAFTFPLDPSVSYLKRIVAVGRDRLEIRAGELWINSQIVPRRKTDLPCRIGARKAECAIWEETLGRGSYLVALPARAPSSFGPTVVPDGHTFVLGDSRDSSADSRHYGPIPNVHLQGRPLFIWWSSDALGTRWDRINEMIR
jgi:signal peptidase I